MRYDQGQRIRNIRFTINGTNAARFVFLHPIVLYTLAFGSHQLSSYTLATEPPGVEMILCRACPPALFQTAQRQQERKRPLLQ